MDKCGVGKTSRSIKLIVVGSCGVGKTSLINSLQKKEFSSTISPTVSPSSLNVKIKTAPNSEVTLQVWDTAGQEKYQSISKMFYRDADICFIVYDHLTVNTVEQWGVTVREEVPDVTIFLIQTKRDLLDEDSQSLIRKGYELQKEHRFSQYFLVSSLTGQGVHDAFLSAALLKSEEIVRKPIEKYVQEKKQGKGCC